MTTNTLDNKTIERFDQNLRNFRNAIFDNIPKSISSDEDKQKRAIVSLSYKAKVLTESIQLLDKSCPLSTQILFRSFFETIVDIVYVASDCELAERFYEQHYFDSFLLTINYAQFVDGEQSEKLFKDAICILTNNFEIFLKYLKPNEEKICRNILAEVSANIDNEEFRKKSIIKLSGIKSLKEWRSFKKALQFFLDKTKETEEPGKLQAIITTLYKFGCLNVHTSYFNIVKQLFVTEDDLISGKQDFGKGIPIVLSLLFLGFIIQVLSEFKIIDQETENHLYNQWKVYLGIE